MTKRQLGGLVILLAVAAYYARDRFPDFPTPDGPPAPDTYNLGQHLAGVDFQGDDAAKFAAMFKAVAEAIMRDASLDTPRLASKDDVTDLVAVLLRYQGLNTYQLQGLAQAMGQAIGSGSEEMTDQDRQQATAVYKSAAAAFSNVR